MKFELQDRVVCSLDDACSCKKRSVNGFIHSLIEETEEGMKYRVYVPNDGYYEVVGEDIRKA